MYRATKSAGVLRSGCVVNRPTSAKWARPSVPGQRLSVVSGNLKGSGPGVRSHRALIKAGPGRRGVGRVSEGQTAAGAAAARQARLAAGADLGAAGPEAQVLGARRRRPRAGVVRREVDLVRADQRDAHPGGPAGEARPDPVAGDGDLPEVAAREVAALVPDRGGWGSGGRAPGGTGTGGRGPGGPGPGARGPGVPGPRGRGPGARTPGGPESGGRWPGGRGPGGGGPGGPGGRGPGGRGGGGQKR
jgi:hypothetical protein